MTFVACTAALIISLLATPLYADDTIAVVLFLAAVGLGGWYGGFGPGLMASALGVLAIDYFFETLQYTWQLTSGYTLTDLVSFLLVAFLLGSLKTRLRLSNTHLRAERDDARAARDARDDLMATGS